MAVACRSSLAVLALPRPRGTRANVVARGDLASRATSSGNQRRPSGSCQTGRVTADPILARLAGLSLDAPYRIFGSLCGLAVGYAWLKTGARLPTDALLQVSRDVGINLQHPVAVTLAWIAPRSHILRQVGLYTFYGSVITTLIAATSYPSGLRSNHTAYIGLALYVQTSGFQPRFSAVALNSAILIMALVGKAWSYNTDSAYSVVADLLGGMLYVLLLPVLWALGADADRSAPLPPEPETQKSKKAKKRARAIERAPVIISDERRRDLGDDFRPWVPGQDE